MSYLSLISLAASVGAPLIQAVLERKIGSENAHLVTGLVEQIAEHAGLSRREVEQPSSAELPAIRDAIQVVEADVPEMIRVYEAELAAKAALFAAEAKEPLWIRAWRPLGMYGLGLLWLWNVMFLHIANAIWKIALPPMDLSILIQLSALYMSLYMGGHTVKAVMGRDREG